MVGLPLYNHSLRAPRNPGIWELGEDCLALNSWVVNQLLGMVVPGWPGVGMRTSHRSVVCVRVRRDE
jgi:hypothetical protein